MDGPCLEERMSMQERGERHRRYLGRDPALIPLPRRYLSRTEAATLMAKGEYPNKDD
jgi:hypothetical protein